MAAPERRTARFPVRRWAECLAAILAGNILFLLLEPHLPVSLQHRAFRLDWGLGVDFALCAGLYAVLGVIRRWSG